MTAVENAVLKAQSIILLPEHRSTNYVSQSALLSVPVYLKFVRV